MAIKKAVKKIAEVLKPAGARRAAGKKTVAVVRTVAPAKKSELTIDHPAEGETVWSGHYAVRINAPAGAVVEASVDGGSWALCRSAAGHWWLDLSGLADGEHELAARVIRDGLPAAAARKFKVASV